MPNSCLTRVPAKILSHLLEMACFCPFRLNCVPPTYTSTDFPPLESTPSANDIFPTPHDHFTDCTLPAQLHSKEGNGEYEWDGGYFLLGMACICVAFLLILSIYYMYARWQDNRQRQREVDRRGLRRLRISRSRVFSMRSSEDGIWASPREGLRRSMVDALPVFLYQPENFTDGLRCTVCLCEFREKEKAKLLPSCKHSFHVDCIDMWFYSHSTCPLCRARVDAQPVDVEVRVIEEEAEEEDIEQGIEKKSGDCCEESGGHAVTNTQN